MTEEYGFNHKPELPESLTVICLAEAAAPSESFVWMMADKTVNEISHRIEVMGLPLLAPELLKVRSLSDSVKKVLAASTRVALITGMRADNSDEPVIHHTHRASGSIITPPGAAFGATPIVSNQAGDSPFPFSQQTPKPWASDTSAPLINTLFANGEAMNMPVWLEDDLPIGGFDFLGIPLPAPESGDWLLPQLGAQFPVVTQALTEILWPIVQDITPPQVNESAG